MTDIKFTTTTRPLRAPLLPVAPEQERAAMERIKAAIDRDFEQLFAGAPVPPTTTTATEPPALTVEALYRMWEDLTRPPVLEWAPPLSDLIDKAVRDGQADGMTSSDLMGLMLVIPWKAESTQSLQTPYGTLVVRFTEQTEKPELYGIPKLQPDPFPVPYNPYGID